MKVRHKPSGTLYDVSGPDWEIVTEKPDTWTDVTAECEIVPSLLTVGPFLNHICDGKRTEVALLGRESKNYHLRKVELLVSIDGQALTPLTRKTAFIIERKES